MEISGNQIPAINIYSGRYLRQLNNSRLLDWKSVIHTYTYTHTANVSVLGVLWSDKLPSVTHLSEKSVGFQMDIKGSLIIKEQISNSRTNMPNSIKICMHGWIMLSVSKVKWENLRIRVVVHFYAANSSKNSQFPSEDNK